MVRMGIEGHDEKTGQPFYEPERRRLERRLEKTGRTRPCRPHCRIEQATVMTSLLIFEFTTVMTSHLNNNRDGLTSIQVKDS